MCSRLVSDTMLLGTNLLLCIVTIDMRAVVTVHDLACEPIYEVVFNEGAALKLTE